MSNRMASFVSSLCVHAIVASFIGVCNVIAFIYGQIEWVIARKVAIDNSKYVVVITGCDSGFGELSSHRLSKLGFHVISGCLTSSGVSRLNGVVANAILCDVTNEKDVEQLALKTEEYITKHKLKLWAVINNAGIGNSGAVDWISNGTLRKVMEVNFFGVVNVTKAMLPLLKRTKNGRIINLSSVAGFISAPMMAAYDSSKHAVEGFAKALRAEMKPWNIHVSNINPGFMRTPIVIGGPDMTKSEFARVPPELRAQYDDNLFEPSKLLHNMLEDPQIVVDAIVDALTDSYPPMWYFPGYQSQFFFRHFTNNTSSLLDALMYVFPHIEPQPKKSVVEKMQAN
mmetsp:Transcript_19309/g.27748  ORF Transcript_19309/g.27748 Transcript_19309/m.27748 type:complete len:341 (-) Transcript_19309:66-1088(-)